jgi:predicted Ser/Thr protein kinase
VCSIGCVFVRDDALETSGVDVKDVHDEVSTAGESDGESGLSSENVNAVLSDARSLAGSAAPGDNRNDAADGGDVVIIISAGLLEAEVIRGKVLIFDEHVFRGL